MTRTDSIDDIPIDGGVIRLGQFLKLSSLIDSGGDAKDAIAAGHVAVNGDVEHRRGRQLQAGDLVTFHDRTVRVRY